MKIQDLLTDKSKWLVKEGRNNKRCFCLSEAIIFCYFPKAQERIKESICSYIKAQSDIFNNMYNTYMLIIRWNDYPGRTFEEVRKLITDLDI